jgi:hypothetical protein
MRDLEYFNEKLRLCEENNKSEDIDFIALFN